MTIGVIGPQFSCEKIKDDMYAISPDTSVILYVREASGDAIQVIEQCEKECDGVIFTGLGPCSSVTQRYEMKIPYEYIEKGVTSITKVFLAMRAANLDVDYFSIDVTNQEVLSDTFAELELSPQNIFSFPFYSYDEKEYMKWHLELWNSHKTKIILTGFVWLYDYFKEQGYPVYYLPITRSNVRDTFQRLKSHIALKEADASQIAVELFRVDDLGEDGENYYSHMLQKSKVESAVIEYSQKIQGTFFAYGRHEYVIFANKGSVKNAENYRTLYALQKQISDMGMCLSVGIGAGVTAYQSESNAGKALQQSQKSKGNYIFLVNDSNVLVGPLGQEQELQYSIISTDTRVLEIAQAVQMSITSISKLMSIITVRKSAIFDMFQLADCLQISTRSARRVSAKLIETGFATVCAKEGRDGGGRPKSLVEIHFLEKSQKENSV